MIKWEKEIDFKDIEKEARSGIRKVLEVSVLDEVTRMVRRTQRGTDINGSAFAPYTPQYAAYRERHNRRTDIVDLTFNGTMLGALIHRIEETPKGVTMEVFFFSEKEALKAAGNQRKREFFGFSDEQVTRIEGKVRG